MGEKLTQAGRPLLEVVGDGALYMGGSGQGLDALSHDPVAQQNRPPPNAKIDTAHLSRYDGTDFVQWYGRKADGRFYPFGKIMRITKAGIVTDRRLPVGAPLNDTPKAPTPLGDRTR